MVHFHFPCPCEMYCSLLYIRYTGNFCMETALVNWAGPVVVPALSVFSHWLFVSMVSKCVPYWEYWRVSVSLIDTLCLRESLSLFPTVCVKETLSLFSIFCDLESLCLCSTPCVLKRLSLSFPYSVFIVCSTIRHPHVWGLESWWNTAMYAPTCSYCNGYADMWVWLHK